MNVFLDTSMRSPTRRRYIFVCYERESKFNTLRQATELDPSYSKAWSRFGNAQEVCSRLFTVSRHNHGFSVRLI